MAPPLNSIIIAVNQFFSGLSDSIETPKLPDKADATRYIDEYINDLTEDEKNRIKKSQREAGELLAEISNAVTEAQVLKGIEKLLKLSVARTPAVVAGDSSTEPAYSKPYRA